jgi:UDP-N-acetylglucosamine acyltransferase
MNAESLIHPTAVVHDSARLGEGVRIGAFSFVDRDVTIGDGCRIGPHVVIHPRVELGPRCAVHAGAVLGDLPQDFAFQDVPSGVRIGAGCTLREGVTVHRGTKENTLTTTGEGCYLMANSHLAHNVTLGNRVIMANGSLLGGYVTVGDGVFISGNSAVHQFVRVGRLAMVGGLSAVSMDLPPFMTSKPSTLNRVVGLNTVGLRRAGVSPAERMDIRNAFSTLYSSGLNIRDALEDLRQNTPSPPVRELIEFVESSERGICMVREW